MNRSLVLRRAAREDLERAWQWYEDERPGLGDEFTTELDELLARVLAGPDQFPIVSDRTRRALLRRFPYALYFLSEEQRVVLLAVVHLHRHPNAWREPRAE